MKTQITQQTGVRLCATAVAALITNSVEAAPRVSSNYSITAEVADLGGTRSSSANYTNGGSAGPVSGISTVTAPVQTAKSGYVAQIVEVTGLLVNASASAVNEADSLQLGAWQVLDDSTFLATDPNTVSWSIVAGPLTGISAAGLASSGIVAQNTSATVSGYFHGLNASLNLTILDTIPDNFGAYAGDGLGDAWQLEFFGENNPLAAPDLDPDGDGASNQFEFIAGLTPTDPASAFRLNVAPVPGQPTRKNIVFSPRLDVHNYTVQTRPSLTAPWQPLGASSQNDAGNQRTVTDLNATGSNRFYRVEITKD